MTDKEMIENKQPPSWQPFLNPTPVLPQYPYGQVANSPFWWYTTITGDTKAK